VSTQFKKRGFKIRVDDVASTDYQALPRSPFARPDFNTSIIRFSLESSSITSIICWMLLLAVSRSQGSDKRLLSAQLPAQRKCGVG